MKKIATLRLLPLVLAAALLSPGRSGAQLGGGRSEIFAGSTFESYLRYLQTVGESKPMPWGIRGFSQTQLDSLAPRDSAHPWAARYNFRGPVGRGFQWQTVRPTVGFVFNSAFPWGSNDGPLWAGKGLTSYAQLGVAIRWGPLSAKVAPFAFRAENTEFPLWSNGKSGILKFANGQFPFVIDMPQRFGQSAYMRLDYGESNVKIEGAGLTAGISTESQWWGPTNTFSYVLSNNAGGFPHLFIGSSRPANIGIGHIHGRVEYGRLSQSPFSPVTGPKYFQNYDFPGRDRLMAGIIGVLQIRGIPGFEVGGTRFFHSAIDSSGIKASDLKLPWQNLLKNSLRNEGDTLFGDDRSLLQNQLASLFFRWAPPSTGIDIYGEFGREDFSADFRDFFQEPDHSSTTNFGFRKAWLRPDRLRALRAEAFMFEAPAGTRTRGEGLIYLHQPLRQGHTYRGQLLGSNVAPGSGSAQTLAFDQFSSGGRWTTFLSRVTVGEVTTETPDYVSGPPVERPSDVQYSLGFEMTRFVGPFDITGRAVATRELNRYLEKDAGNVNLALMIRQAF